MRYSNILGVLAVTLAVAFSAAAQTNGQRGATSAPPELAVATAKVLNAAIEALGNKRYDEAAEAIATLDRSRLRPYERSRAEQIRFNIAYGRGSYDDARAHLEAELPALAALQAALDEARAGVDAAAEDFRAATNAVDALGQRRASLREREADAEARAGAQVYLALYENNLWNPVAAGENRGKRLRHDFVVRDLAGPFSFDAGGEARLQRRFALDSSWKTGDLHVAAFIQDERSGDVLQALATPACR